MHASPQQRALYQKQLSDDLECVIWGDTACVLTVVTASASHIMGVAPSTLRRRYSILHHSIRFDSNRFATIPRRDKSHRPLPHWVPYPSATHLIQDEKSASGATACRLACRVMENPRCVNKQSGVWPEMGVLPLVRTWDKDNAATVWVKASKVSKDGVMIDNKLGEEWMSGVRCASWELWVGGRIVGQTGFHTKFLRDALLSRILVRKEGVRWVTCTTARRPRPRPTVISTGLARKATAKERRREGAENAQKTRREGRWVVRDRWRGIVNVLDDERAGRVSPGQALRSLDGVEWAMEA